MTSLTRFHLTPKDLVGQRFAPNTFGGIRIALMGFCPPPRSLDAYQPQSETDQHFIHVSPRSVRTIKHGSLKLLSLEHVYGGPVASSTVEELAFYGFDYILAYGLAGGLGTKGLAMGDFYVVNSATAFDGTSRHYSPDRKFKPDFPLADEVADLWDQTQEVKMHPVNAATGDAIYREDDRMLDEFRSNGCDIVNLDSSHLYAVSKNNSEGKILKTIQCGVISDVISAQVEEVAESTLSVMLSNEPTGELNPLERTGDVVSFYIEKLAPTLAIT
ncbi:hypothetical protein [uncultured Roseibium sp.]|uniref:phosphorylase family protein n=1 Tax=uncultured Roseibium sp. TaxID=1936171 RepID=UPI00262F4C3F|nr:hypothetical protein [uncultured Roseibium sp.]